MSAEPIEPDPPDPTAEWVAEPAAIEQHTARPHVRHDDLEAATLGAALLNPDALAAVRSTGITWTEFRDPTLRRVARAIFDIDDAGDFPDPILIDQRITLTGGEPLGREVHDRLAYAPAGAAPAASYARGVRQLAHQRKVITAADAVQRSAGTPTYPQALQALVDTLDTPAAPGQTDLRTATLGDLIAEDEPDHDWAIPNILEMGDRCLLTGPEGGGKSTLLRQMAVQAAAGIHPFTLEEMPPLIVVLLDVENSRRHIRRQIRPLSIAAGHHADPNLHILSHPQGLDLTDPQDQADLRTVLTDIQPALIVGGPVYKLFDGDPNEEAPAKATAMYIGHLIADIGCAVMLETHQPHEVKGKRPERPYGASLWKRWPEFGLHLSEKGELRHWRGDRDERAWPAALKRGGAWPWTTETDTKAILYARISDTCRQEGKRLTIRELAGLLDADRNAVQRAIDANKMSWDGLCHVLSEADDG